MLNLVRFLGQGQGLDLRPQRGQPLLLNRAGAQAQFVLGGVEQAVEEVEVAQPLQQGGGRLRPGFEHAANRVLVGEHERDRGRGVAPEQVLAELRDLGLAGHEDLTHAANLGPALAP